MLGRALAAGHRPRSVLCSPRWLADVEAMLADVPGGPDVPVYLAETDVLEAITGFHVHRGALAAMHRPELPAVADLLARRAAGAGRPGGSRCSRTSSTTPTSVRSSARPRRWGSTPCWSPRGVRTRCTGGAVRVSMGTVFQVPWTRIDPWPGGVDLLRGLGFTVAALALSDDAVTPGRPGRRPAPQRLALVLGAEGDGLGRRPSRPPTWWCGSRWPVAVDSLNVAAASAVAFWATR